MGGVKAQKAFAQFNLSTKSGKLRRSRVVKKSESMWWLGFMRKERLKILAELRVCRFHGDEQ